MGAASSPSSRSRGTRGPSRTPTPTRRYFIVVEGGGWVGVGDERTRIAAGEAAVWPADLLHSAWTEHSEMRAFMVELAGADDGGAGPGRGPRAHPGRRSRRSRAASASWRPGRRSGPPRTRRWRARVGGPDRRRASSGCGRRPSDQLLDGLEEVEEVVDLVGLRQVLGDARARRRRRRAGRSASRVRALAQDLGRRRDDGIELEGRTRSTRTIARCRPCRRPGSATTRPRALGLGPAQPHGAQAARVHQVVAQAGSRRAR